MRESKKKQRLRPTQYLDVNSVLSSFLRSIKNILKDNFVGMYLYGSLALGDFCYESSDIDFIVITNSTISEDVFQALSKLHEDFKQTKSFWADKVEAAYIIKNAMNHKYPTDEKYPQIEKDRNLLLEPLEIGWAFQAYTLREYGVTIDGPDIKTLLEPVGFDSMKEAAVSILKMWAKDSTDPSWIEWLQVRKEQIFVIQTLCRFHYLIKNRTVISKLKAVEWSENNLDERWRELINFSELSKNDKVLLSEKEIDETIEFIKFTLITIDS